jgi:hypothetical protein
MVFMNQHCRTCSVIVQVTVRHLWALSFSMEVTTTPRYSIPNSLPSVCKWENRSSRSGFSWHGNSRAFVSRFKTSITPGSYSLVLDRDESITQWQWHSRPGASDKPRMFLLRLSVYPFFLPFLRPISWGKCLVFSSRPLSMVYTASCCQYLCYFFL